MHDTNDNSMALSIAFYAATT
ncbi:hypothetical protein RHIZ404_220557 [Rhizobium sp. EC-SD404]|nr:hypothetical protein RHIZ404_220557 [Rhizobium sp. EC-SD404]